MQVITCRNNATGLVTLAVEGHIQTQTVEKEAWDRIGTGCTLIMYTDWFGVTDTDLTYYPDPWAACFKFVKKETEEECESIYFEYLPDAWRPPEFSGDEITVAKLLGLDLNEQKNYQMIKELFK